MKIYRDVVKDKTKEEWYAEYDKTYAAIFGEPRPKTHRAGFIRLLLEDGTRKFFPTIEKPDGSIIIVGAEEVTNTESK